jgi:hypothetical protein
MLLCHHHRMTAQEIGLSVAIAIAGTLLLQPLAHAEQWAYAMQTGHGNHSIQVDVDSLAQQQGYIAARLLYEYYPKEGSASEPSGSARSAVVDGAFDCKERRFQPLSRTEYAAAEAKGAAGTTTRTVLAAERWKPASGDPETFAIVDWVCSVATHKLADGQAGSKP